ncbi:F-box protein CPR1-like [Papaver somniferum]|uniref:F-box protein CPR1-like n=1 Tax=Papaver somniferum TaxID=3469 RepID=UPI000E6FD94E|nr:F-box protein CPR1-like [Papaver somniferum]
MKKILGAVSNISTLPEEIQVDIFIKVPMKYIGISRCVCKLWRNLLHSSKFIGYHLNYTNANKNNQKLMCLTKDHYSLHSIEYASVSSLSPMPSFNKAGKWIIEICGSCNGLVCLRIYGCDEKCNGKYCICIWNPLTREYKEMSDSFGTSLCFKFRCGFGYDCNFYTYKLVRIAIIYETGTLEIRVKTLASDSWTHIRPALTYSFPDCYVHTCGLIFNGALHWLGTNTTQETSFEVIMSFNISTERFEDIRLPEHTLAHPNGKEWCTSLAVLGDNLCLFNVDPDSLVEMWVMLEYGVRESWTKQLSITHQVKALTSGLWIFTGPRISACKG